MKTYIPFVAYNTTEYSTMMSTLVLYRKIFFTIMMHITYLRQGIPYLGVGLGILLYTSCASYGLHQAIVQNDTEKVTQLLNEGTAIESPSVAKESTPLITASLRGYTEIMQILIRRGADVNRTRPDSNTPLRAAIANNHLEAVQLLVESGADVNLVSSTGWSPLMSAARYNTDTSITKYLIAQGANYKQRNLEGGTALEIAFEAKNLRVFNYLLALEEEATTEAE